VPDGVRGLQPLCAGRGCKPRPAVAVLARPAACPRKQRFRTGLQTPSGSGEMIQAAVTNKLVFLILLNILLLILGAILDIFSAHPSGSCELRN